MLKGFATAEGTARYRDRFPQLRDAGHFRHPQGVPGAEELWMPSLGLGTYLGEPADSADAQYEDAISARSATSAPHWNASPLPVNWRGMKWWSAPKQASSASMAVCRPIPAVIL